MATHSNAMQDLDRALFSGVVVSQVKSPQSARYSSKEYSSTTRAGSASSRSQAANYVPSVNSYTNNNSYKQAQPTNYVPSVNSYTTNNNSYKQSNGVQPANYVPSVPNSYTNNNSYKHAQPANYVPGVPNPYPGVITPYQPDAITVEALVEMEQFSRNELLEFQQISFCVIDGFQETLFNVTYERLVKLQRIIEGELWVIVESSYKEIRKAVRETEITQREISKKEVIDEHQLLNSCRIMEQETRIAENASDEAVIMDLTVLMKSISRENSGRVRKAVAYLGREFREAVGQMINVVETVENRKATAGDMALSTCTDLNSRKQEEQANLAKWEAVRSQARMEDNMAMLEDSIERIIEVRSRLLSIVKQRISNLKTEFNSDFSFSYDEDHSHAYKKMEVIIQVSKQKFASETEVIRAEYATLEAGIRAREEQIAYMVDGMRLEELKFQEEIDSNTQRQALLWDRITDMLYQYQQLATQRAFSFGKYMKYRKNFELRVHDTEVYLITARALLKEMEEFINHRNCDIEIIEQQIIDYKKDKWNQHSSEERSELLLAEQKEYIKGFTEYYFLMNDTVVKYAERIDELDIMIQQNEFNISNARKFMDDNACQYRKQVEHWTNLRENVSTKMENMRFSIISARSEFEVMTAELQANGLLLSDPIADAENWFGQSRQRNIQRRAKFQEMQSVTTQDEMSSLSKSSPTRRAMPSPPNVYRQSNGGAVRSTSPTSPGSYKRSAMKRMEP